ncbi:hypothetical protein DFH06DRAFT_1206636 [Mycena polygramma]|nr:hypothetical protein DFH06DRAFT_1206636 [Mycena polygramma]
MSEHPRKLNLKKSLGNLKDSANDFRDRTAMNLLPQSAKSRADSKLKELQATFDAEKNLSVQATHKTHVDEVARRLADSGLNRTPANYKDRYGDISEALRNLKRSSEEAKAQATQSTSRSGFGAGHRRASQRNPAPAPSHLAGQPQAAPATSVPRQAGRGASYPHPGGQLPQASRSAASVPLQMGHGASYPYPGGQLPQATRSMASVPLRATRPRASSYAMPPPAVPHMPQYPTNPVNPPMVPTQSYPYQPILTPEQRLRYTPPTRALPPLPVQPPPRPQPGPTPVIASGDAAVDILLCRHLWNQG